MTGVLAEAAGVLAASPTRLPRWRAENDLRRRCAKHGAIALTYDDGPGRRVTPRVLELLREYDAHATFYLLGSRALEAPEVVDHIAAGGHELGCHGFAHVNALTVSRSSAARDIEQGYEALSPWLPRDGAFRPPFGKIRPHTWRELRRRGAPVGWWTIDSRDSLFESLDVDAVVAETERAGGGVVLLHDFDRGAADAAREQYTLSLTEALLALARRRGWLTTTQSALP